LFWCDAKIQKKWNIDIFIEKNKKIMKTLRLTETELKRLVRKVISEQSLPKYTQLETYTGEKMISSGVDGGNIKLSEITEIHEDMKKFINSLPNGRVVGELMLEPDYSSIFFTQKFETSLSVEELKEKYD
jgi:hypothetical protein